MQLAGLEIALYFHTFESDFRNTPWIPPVLPRSNQTEPGGISEFSRNINDTRRHFCLLFNTLGMLLRESNAIPNSLQGILMTPQDTSAYCPIPSRYYEGQTAIPNSFQPPCHKLLAQVIYVEKFFWFHVRLSITCMARVYVLVKSLESELGTHRESQK